MVKFLGVIAITLLVVEFAEPIQFIKRLLGIDNKAEPESLFNQVLQKLTNCALCMGFWIGLAFYQDIYMASIISFASELTYLIYNQITNKLNGL